MTVAYNTTTQQRDEVEQTDCGKCSCIVVYSSEQCVLCDAALEIMYNVISDFGLSTSIIRKVDVLNSVDVECEPPVPIGLPTIRICGEFISGLPDVDEARGVVMHAVLKSCFSHTN